MNEAGLRNSVNRPAELPDGFNARRLRANLLRSGPFLERLAALGLDASIIAAAGLGLKEPYVTASRTEVDGVVTYPLRAQGSRWRYGCIAIDGLTINPDHPIAWSAGDPCAFRYGEGSTLLVMRCPISVLQARSSIDARGLDVTVVCSSQPDRLPSEWTSASYWATWKRIVIADGVASSMRRRIAMCASRPVELATGAIIERLGGVAISQSIDAWIDGMLEDARPLSSELAAETDFSHAPGDFQMAAISLHGGMAAGRMYYPFAVERRRAAGPGAPLLCSYETVVVRSDGAVVEARTLPAPSGTPPHLRVHALTDGTRVCSPPQVSRNATWSLDGIRNFIAKRAAGADPCAREPAKILADVRSAIRARVWLPEEDDVWVATAFVVMTHVFRAFQALPILLIQGGKGTGKTELASTIASLSFNAVTMGQGSAAALVRVARECGGLVVLDDAEGLSDASRGFGELSQCLKVGYRASTAVKPIVLPSGRVETFDFFGPRVLTCTRGVEPVLASRCIGISTGIRPDGAGQDADVDVDRLRDELHGLAMSRVFDVHEARERWCGPKSTRLEEIWSPLLTIVRLFDADRGTEALGRAYARAATG